MKWIGWLNRNPQHATSEKPTTTATATVTVTGRPKTKHTSGWGCILMTTSHSSRCWNTWYIYMTRRPDMSMKWVGCLNPHNLTQHATSVEPTHSPAATATTVTVRPSISCWGCILMTTSCSRRCWNTLHYIYVWSRPDISIKWVGCLNHYLQHDPSEKPR